MHSLRIACELVCRMEIEAMVHEGQTVSLFRYESANRLITRLDSYRLLERMGKLRSGDTEALMQAWDEYLVLSGVDVRSYQGNYGNQTLDRLRRDVGL